MLVLLEAQILILIPEIPYSIKSIAKHIDDIRSNGRNHALIVVAEAVKKENGKKLQLNMLMVKSD